MLERAKPQLEGGRAEAGDEYKDAFAAYVKRGETKALTIGSPPGGGYLVPAETETEITRLLTAVSPIRAIAGVRQVSTSSLQEAGDDHRAGGGLGGGDRRARPATTSQTLDLLDFPTAELYAMPAATQVFIDDAAVDVGQWIADEVNAAFAAQETDGVRHRQRHQQAQGLPRRDQGRRTRAGPGTSIGYVATGDGGRAAGERSERRADRPRLCAEGRLPAERGWVMNRKTQGALRKLKDDDGNYLWQPALTPDGKATLMGFPLVEVEDMPDIAANSFSIAFGDFRRGYLIVDRQGVNVLRDPYSAPSPTCCSTRPSASAAGCRTLTRSSC